MRLLLVGFICISTGVAASSVQCTLKDFVTRDNNAQNEARLGEVFFFCADGTEIPTSQISVNIGGLQPHSQFSKLQSRPDGGNNCAFTPGGGCTFTADSRFSPSSEIIFTFAAEACDVRQYMLLDAEDCAQYNPSTVWHQGTEVIKAAHLYCCATHITAWTMECTNSRSDSHVNFNTDLITKAKAIEADLNYAWYKPFPVRTCKDNGYKNFQSTNFLLST